MVLTDQRRRAAASGRPNLAPPLPPNCLPAQTQHFLPMPPAGWANGSRQRLRSIMVRERTRRHLLLLAAAGLAVLLTAAVKLRQQPRQAQAAAAPPPADGAKAAAPAGVDWRHPLFRRVAEDLTLFNLSGITHKMVEQAYCQGTRASMRVQVRGWEYWAGVGGQLGWG